MSATTYPVLRWQCRCGRFVAESAITETNHRDDSYYYLWVRLPGTGDVPSMQGKRTHVTTIGYAASQPHYLRHLQPVIDGLRAAGTEVIEGRHESMLVASRIDAERACRIGAPRHLILVEHGAGQRYFNPNRGGWLDGSGGPPDPNVTLFLAPSERVAHQMADKLPNARAEVVGSPAVERLARLRADTIARMEPAGVEAPYVFTCHWQMTPIGVDEAGSSFPWSLRVLDRMPRERTFAHGHPRIQARLHVHAANRHFAVESDWDRLASMAAVVVADNTSAMWEALTVGVPVVAMTPPKWSDDAPHGFPRFGPNRVRLPTIYDPAHTTAVIDTALGSMVANPHVYDVVDGATARAVSVILSHVVD